jgi:DNA-directed RNA polymerase subunit RPC12/RpoP
LRPLASSVKGKPYLTCNECGVQVFVRGKEGIRQLRRVMGHGELTGNVRDLSPLLDYFAFLRGRLREIQKQRPIVGKNADLEIEAKLVRSELDRVGKLMKRELVRQPKTRSSSRSKRPR